MKCKGIKVLATVLAFMLAASTWDFNIQNVYGSMENTVKSESGAALSESEIEVKGSNSLGNMLAATLLEEDEKNSGDCYVSGVDVKGNSAVVSYVSSVECDMVVAIYDEKTGQMTASGTERVLGDGEGTASIGLQGNMPKYFKAAVYLLDAESHAPLCGAYITEEYTEEMQKLADMDTADFAQERVLNMDGDTQNNFAVYKEGTKVIDYQEDNGQVSGDGKGTYTVQNAGKEFKSLKAGDTFSYTDKAGEALIVKVKHVDVRGGTVTIEEDPSLCLEDVFDYVKIEGGYQAEQGARAIFPIDIDKELTSLTKSFAWTKSIGSGNLTATLKASGTLTAAPYIKIYIVPSSQHVECTVTFSASFDCSVNGRASRRTVDLLDNKISLTPVSGVVFELMPQIEFEASGEAAFTAKMAAAAGFSWDSGSGFVNKCVSPRLTECNFHVEAQIYLGLRLAPEVHVEFASIDVGNVSLDARAGVLIVGKLEVTGIQGNTSHLCKACIGGDITAKIKVDVSAALFSMDPISKEVLNANPKISDFYYSMDFDDFGWRTCPHYAYKVTVSTVDANGNPVPNIEVIGTGLEENPVTDVNGKMEIFLESGSYTLNVRTAEYKGTADLVVENTAKTVELKLEGRSVVASGECGADLEWRLDDSGTLAITGTGDMINWTNANAVPWSPHRKKISVVEMDDGVTGIGDYAFDGCQNLVSAPIPGTVTDIGRNAFNGCGKLTGLLIPGSVTYMGMYAFNNCDSIEEIEIPPSITFLERNVFAGCDELKHVTIPSTVTVIEQSAFEGCSKLMTAEIGGGKINANAFKDCTRMTAATLGSNVRSNIESRAFYNCSSLKSITVPDGVTKIVSEAFSGCSSLSTVVLGNGITDIEQKAFENCTRLSGISIPDKVTHIGQYAFSNCSSMAKLTLGSSLAVIDNYAFQNCSRLGSVTFPASIKQIGAYDFLNCSSLSTIYFEGDKPYCTYIDGHGYNGWARCFQGVVATAYYPSSWESTPDPGSNITWVPYGRSSANTASLNTTAEGVGATGTGVDQAEEGRASVGAEGGEAMAVERGESVGTGAAKAAEGRESLDAGISKVSTEVQPEPANASSLLSPKVSAVSVTKEGIQQAAYFNKLTAGSEYVMLVVKDANAESLLDADNLLYIAQDSADSKGRLIFSYVPRAGSKSEIKLYGTDGTTDPADPEDPDFKDEPDKPDKPDNPENPDKPENPDTPDKPTDSIIEIGKCAIKLSSNEYVYNGSARKPSLTVKNGKITLVKEKDYKVFYENNINAGIATVTVIGIGKYTGMKNSNFIIQKSPNTVKAANLKIGSSAKARSISVKATAKGGAKLSYKSNVKAIKVNGKGKVTIAKNYVGRVTVTITAAATANYKQASARATITVNPSKSNLTKLQNKKGKKLEIRWKKNTAADGYQIQYSTNAKLKKDAKMVKVPGAKKTSKTVSKLKKGKTYYIRIRVYKKSAGSTYYSDWSSVKKVKIKK